jgi:iron uptake system EfeUOB component EfeO/EfeM
MGPSMRLSWAVGLALLNLQAAAAAPAAAAELDAAISLGLASTKEQAAVLTAYATVLNETIASGDLAAARKAYALARPPYEQIEVM